MNFSTDIPLTPQRDVRGTDLLSFSLPLGVEEGIEFPLSWRRRLNLDNEWEGMMQSSGFPGENQVKSIIFNATEMSFLVNNFWGQLPSPHKQDLWLPILP